MSRWTTSKTAIYNLGYHIIWIPKYRKHLLKPRIEHRLKALIYEKAIQINICIENMEVMPDHIHIFLKCTPKHAITEIVRNLKGYTSFMLRKEFPYLYRYPSLWTRSYYCESVGHISESTIKKYINEQKLRG